MHYIRWSVCLFASSSIKNKKHSSFWRKRYSLDEIAAQSLLFLKNSKILSLNTLVGSLKFYAHAASCLLSTNKFVTKKFTTHKKVFTVYLNVYLNLITMFIIMVIWLRVCLFLRFLYFFFPIFWVVNSPLKDSCGLNGCYHY